MVTLEEYKDRILAGETLAQIFGVSQSSGYDKLKELGWPKPSEFAGRRRRESAEDREAWISDYNICVDAGLSPTGIISRMGEDSGVFYRKLRKYGCKRYTANQRHARRLIDVWVARGDRFTVFDFPEFMDGNEVQPVIQDAVASGELVCFGEKVVRCQSASMPRKVYGPPDSVERVPSLAGVRGASLDGDGY